MKRFLFLTFFSFLSISTFSQNYLSGNQKLETLCKVWGFLKYYHPIIAKGEIDWDQQLIKHIPLVISAKNKQELSRLYVDWIDSLGRVKACNKCRKTVIPGSLTKKPDLKWLENQDLFSDSLIAKLEFIRDNRSQRINYNSDKSRLISPVSFEDRQPYSEMAFPSTEYRLLSMFRFWNVINYYFPYEEDIGEDWNDVLKEMIGRNKNVKDTVEYQLLMAEFTARINDSHSGLMNQYIMQHIGSYLVPFRIRIIDEKAVVTGFYNDSLSRMDDIRHGDAIVSVNGKPVSEIIAERSIYSSASNMPRKLNKIAGFLLNGINDSIWITFDREGKLFQKSIHRYKINDLGMDWQSWWKITYADTNQMIRVLNDHTGYINMGLLMRKDVSRVMKQMMNMNAIIFDMRNYPNGTAWSIAKYLSAKKTPFARYSCPQKGNPGIFEEKMDYGGSRNSHPYQGKVVILTNELTISQAEYSCMLIQAVIPTTIIGSQTAGADGDIALFTFPGGYKVAFSGHGIYYPDGRKTQRIGIVPDIKVEQTIDGVRNGKDEILERAVQFLSAGK
jgi:carboxyl-terminal processing protease